MTWVILTGRQSDLDPVDTPHKTITNRDYLTHPNLFRGQRPKVINLSGSYAYQSRGYYASLLASSRGHRVIPTVETMIDLSEKKLYEAALPELEQALNRQRKELGGTFPARASVFFGIGPDKVWDRFSRLLFDWFRAPALDITIKDNGSWATIAKIGFLPLDAHQANLLFQVVSRRYEQGSIILTSNKSYGEWAEVFAGDAVIAAAILDRLLHHSTTISIKGDSYRLKDKRRAGLLRKEDAIRD